MRSPPHPPSIFEWVVDVLVAPARHARALLGFAYVTGFGGLLVAMLGTGSDGIGLRTLGILSMFVSFTVLFYLSVTILSAHEN